MRPKGSAPHPRFGGLAGLGPLRAMRSPRSAQADNGRRPHDYNDFGAVTLPAAAESAHPPGRETARRGPGGSRALTLAPPPRARLTFAVLSADARGAAVEQVAA